MGLFWIIFNILKTQQITFTVNKRIGREISMYEGWPILNPLIFLFQTILIMERFQIKILRSSNRIGEGSYFVETTNICITKLDEADDLSTVV